MFHKIKDELDKELHSFIKDIDKIYSLRSLSPLLSNAIKDFVLRKGKRLRPILFIVGYRGFAKKITPSLYKGAIAIELLHDFMLIHDDIIDKSDKRRGKPSLHKMLDNYLSNYKDIKFNGQDLAIVAGDIIYAMSINAFLSMKENPKRKEKALRSFAQAGIYAGSGEFIELLCGVKKIEAIGEKEIYKIYDYKTSYYTFSCPLATGAILAGAKNSQVNKLSKCGLYLGRAFQIKDDILGMFGDENKIGKSVMSDLQEGKKTILIWYAYNNSDKNNRLFIKRILSKENINNRDLHKMRKIIEKSGALKNAKNEITSYLKRAVGLIESLKMRRECKKFLYAYCQELLRL